MRAYLGLSTGDIFPGESFCFFEETSGDVILYNSKDFRYQILTDPVNYGKIIVSDSNTIDDRWPLFSEIESFSPHLKGLVILGALCESDFQSRSYNLKNYLASNQVSFFKPFQSDLLGIVLDKIGPTTGIITSSLDTAKNFNGKNSSTTNRFKDDFVDDNDDPVRSLSTTLEFFWDMPGQRRYNGKFIEKKYVVVAYDFGLPYSTLRNLSRLGCDIRIVPADCPPEEMVALKPEGILLAGGPGNPIQMDYAIQNIARLIGLRPILASGLGYILLGLSMGAALELLDKPHFGSDIIIESVKKHGELHIARFKTHQTHLVNLKRKSLEHAGFEVTLINTADMTVEGYENDEFLIQSYAFSLGDEDEFTFSCMRKFVDCMEMHRTGDRLI